jgi:flagellar hook-basal body complex protein FliE
MKAFKKHIIPFVQLVDSWNRGQQKNPHLSESVNEAIKPQGYSQLNTMAKHAGIYIRDLLKALRKQDDNAVIREVHFLAAQFTTMEKMLKDKKWNAKYNESVSEARTINVEPNWEGVWRYFKYMAQTNPTVWKRMQRNLGSEWGKLEKMAQQKRWQSESAILEFSKYRLGGLLDSKLKKRLERTIKVIGGKVDAVGDDYIKFRMGGMDLNKLPAVIKKLDRNKNVWIGDKYSKNIWDRKRNIDRLESVNEAAPTGRASIVGLSGNKDLVIPKNQMSKAKGQYKKMLNHLMKAGKSMNQPGEIDMMVSHMEDAYDEMLALWKNVKVVKKESVNEAVEPQGNMAKIAKVVKDKQATKLSGVMIDMQSANLLMKLWDAVSDKDKEKMNKMNAKLLTSIIKKLWSRINLKLPI